MWLAQTLPVFLLGATMCQGVSWGGGLGRDRAGVRGCHGLGCCDRSSVSEGSLARRRKPHLQCQIHEGDGVACPCRLSCFASQQAHQSDREEGCYLSGPLKDPNRAWIVYHLSTLTTCLQIHTRKKRRRTNGHLLSNGVFAYCLRCMRHPCRCLSPVPWYMVVLRYMIRCFSALPGLESPWTKGHIHVYLNLFTTSCWQVPSHSVGFISLGSWSQSLGCSSSSPGYDIIVSAVPCQGSYPVGSVFSSWW